MQERYRNCTVPGNFVLCHKLLPELLKTWFDPNHNYFVATQERQLFPNTQAQGEQTVVICHFSQSSVY